MKFRYLKYVIMLIGIFCSSALFSQTKIDNEYPEDEEYDWVYLNLDLGYGSRGIGGALGFRYSFFGLGVSATGFATDIPNTSPYTPSNQANLVEKKYPSNTVCLDFFGYYDLDEVSLFANIGYYASVDSILSWDKQEHVYYRSGGVTQAGLCYGLGAQIPLTFIDESNVRLEQLVGGIGYHSKLGLYIRIAYRW